MMSNVKVIEESGGLYTVTIIRRDMMGAHHEHKIVGQANEVLMSLAEVFRSRDTVYEFLAYEGEI